MEDDIKELDAYAETRSNPYGISYEKICSEIKCMIKSLRGLSNALNGVHV